MSEKRAHSRLVESGILGGFLEKAGFWRLEIRFVVCFEWFAGISNRRRWRLDLAFAASRYLLIYENIGDS
jgi:hypothetical protein